MDYRGQTERRPRRSIKKLLLILIALSLLGYGFWQYFDQAATASFPGSSILGAFNTKPQPIDSVSLSAKLGPLISQFTATGWQLGLYVYDFQTQSSYSDNPDQSFTAASLTKLPVLLTVYSEIQSGKLNEAQMVPFTADELQDYGTSILQYHGPGTQYSLKDLLWYMANRSDNSAFQVLVDLVGLDTVEKNLYRWGFKTTSVKSDVITPREAVRLFDLAYSGKIVSGPLKDEMLGLLVKTEDESRIPAGVPSNVRVIHKEGNAIGGLMDAGVVELKDRPYAIAILATNADDETKETSLEAQISQTVYDYMKSL